MGWLYGLADASRLQILTLCGPQSSFQGTPGTDGHMQIVRKLFKPGWRQRKGSPCKVQKLGTLGGPGQEDAVAMVTRS